MSKEIVPGYDNLHLSSYLKGFFCALTFTILAFLTATDHSIDGFSRMFIIIVLAIVQFILQLVFFLHLGEDRKPKWKTGVMLMMILIVLILVLGSLWIMKSLDYRMLPSTKQIDNYLNSQSGGL